MPALSLGSRGREVRLSLACDVYPLVIVVTSLREVRVVVLEAPVV